ncbi:cytidine deaminase family protein [Bifidobacterium panos]|uniref:cytidine deaminase family protein n=1 Tax=Bifidobacterium panos TaxID=2675321 RepID=UPI001557BB07|nr:cytidine deaminase [Bifidobacterium sp. DSM 109963]
MGEIWNTLYHEASRILKPRKVSEMLETAGVGAAVEAISGEIYVGVCVDGACTLGICAERNAIFTMLTNGEDAIKRVVAVNWDGKVLPPCGACRELMTQLMPEQYGTIEVLLDYENGEVATLGELTPKWWI